MSNASLATTPSGLKIVFSSHLAMPQMKNIGARFDNKQRLWTMPILVSNLLNLQRLVPDVELSPSLQAILDSPTGYRLMKDVSRLLPEVQWLRAMDHQKEALQRGVNNPNKGYLYALGKGLGKTFTAISHAQAVGAERALVVCVKSLIPMWIDQIKQWTGETASNCHGHLPYGTRWNVTNYETLNSYDFVKGYKWDIVIVDESVLVQNRKGVKNAEGETVRKGTARTADVGELRGASEYMLLLSGSPTSKHADRLWPQFNILFPYLFTSYWRFAKTYCDVVPTAWGDKVVATKDWVDFGVEFKDILYRVTTEQVKGKTSILYENIAVELTSQQAKIYDGLMQEFEAELDGAEITTSNKLSRLIRLAQCTSNLKNFGDDWPDSSAKTDILMEVLPDYDVPCIIWTHWVESARVLYNRMVKKGYRVGIYNGTYRSDGAIEGFQQGGLDFLILSLGTGKFGFTFAAKTAIYHDKFWDADAYGQSLSRISGRIGVDIVPVVVSLTAPRTVDDLIIDNLTGKLESITQVSNENLKRLLGGLKKR